MRRRETLLERCWKVRIEARERGRTFYQAYWCMAQRLGQAIEHVLHVARTCGIDEPIARAALPLDLFWVPDDDTWPTPHEETRCGERYYFSLRRRFVPPWGIIESCQCTDLATTTMRTGFTHTHCPDPQTLHVVVSRHQVLPVFACLIEMLPLIDSVTVDHMSNCRRHRERSCQTEYLHRPGALLDFVVDHDRSLLENGFVTLTAHAPGNTVIALNEHKDIVFASERADLLSRAKRTLLRHGVRERDEVLSLATVPHHHFRRPGSPGPRPLWAMLRRQGFEPWLESLTLEKD